MFYIWIDTSVVFNSKDASEKCWCERSEDSVPADWYSDQRWSFSRRRRQHLEHRRGAQSVCHGWEARDHGGKTQHLARWTEWNTDLLYISLPQTICPIAQGGNKNLELSPLALFAFFVTRCRENLHIVVAFSPIGDAFRNRLRQFPSLINCCTIDWFQVGVCVYGILKSSVLLSHPERKFNEGKGRTRDDQSILRYIFWGLGILWSNQNGLYHPGSVSFLFPGPLSTRKSEQLLKTYFLAHETLVENLLILFLNTLAKELKGQSFLLTSISFDLSSLSFSHGQKRLLSE